MIKMATLAYWMRLVCERVHEYLKYLFQRPVCVVCGARRGRYYFGKIRWDNPKHKAGEFWECKKCFQEAHGDVN